MDGNMPTTQVPRTSKFRVTKHASAEGTYWVSTASKQQLVEALRAADPVVKSASIGGEQETGFEQAFSSLAYAYIKDKSPRLLDYTVGFQLVDRNEDNTKAVGVFGFKVGKQWLYAPVFFLNGDLKGHELLYIKNQDTFVPMKENWVNYIMSRKPHVLGEGSPKDVFQLGGLSPNIERLSWPPHGNKYGSDLLVDEWAQPFLLPLAACQTKSARFLFRDATHGRTVDMKKIANAPFTAALAEFPNLRTFLTSDWRMAKAAYDLTKKYPLLKVSFDKFYGDNFFQEVAVACKQAQDTGAMLIGLTKKAAAAPRSTSFLGIPKAVKRASGDSKVKIVTKDDVSISNNLPELTEKDKTEVLSHGYLVKDERTGDEVTKVYNTQTRQELQNPHETGIYEVLERPGKFEKMLVISHPTSNCGGQDFCTVVRIGDGEKAWINAHRTAVFAKKIELDEEYRKWFKKLGDKDTLTKGGVYMAVNDRGQGTVPFRVQEKYEDGRYKVDFKDSEDKRRAPGLPRLSNSIPTAIGSSEDYISSYGALLVLNARKDASLRAISGELHVPETFKFFKLKDPPKPKKDEGGCGIMVSCDDGAGSDEPRPIVPGDIGDIQLLFTEKTAKLKLLGDNHEVSIFSDKTASHTRLSYGQALFHLIRVHGTTEKAAKEMLKSAQHRGTIYREPVQFNVKYADSYPYPGPGPSAPPQPAPQYGSEPMGYNAVNAIYPQEEHMPIPGMDSNRTDPRIYDPFLNITPDQGAIQYAQQAGQKGQKEVFDTAVISSMLKAVRQDTLVDRYLGDLMKAVDKLGRLLFMFYWHQEEFADRYGKSDLPELEDSLRNAFEMNGDVVLFLKEKTIEPGLDEIQDPTIEEAARN